MSTVRITVVINNHVMQRGLLAEHGWACWIETPKCRVLFDTGQGLALPHNVAVLDMPLDSADAIVLSHGHYDHTGGLGYALQRAPQTLVYAHPAAFEPKFARNPDGSTRAVGIPTDVAELRRRLGDRLILTAEPTAVAPGITVTGQVPRTVDYEDTGGPFFLDEAGTQPDLLFDDQAIFIDTPAGAAVVLGCAHAGLVNTLQHISSLTGGQRPYLVLGGTHLHRATPHRLSQTVAALREMQVHQVAPAHCTGPNAFAYLRHELGEQCVAVHCGAIYEI